MDFKWISSDFKQDKIILAGDIGGTNTNLAIVGQTGSKFTILMSCTYSSQEVTDLLVPVEEVINAAVEKDAALKPQLCCISAAGPVADNTCKMTNCDFDVAPSGRHHD